MLLRAAGAAAAVFALAVAQTPQPRVAWSAVPLNSSTLATGVTWQQLNVSTVAPGVPFWGMTGPLVVNIVAVDLSAPGVRLTPVTANATAKLQPLNAMAADDGRKLLAGINGGYFWRVDVDTFVDSVCQGKTKSDALMPPSAGANAGVGDCSTVAGGVLLSNNCDLPGFSRPSILTLNGTASYISVLHRGATPPAGLALDSLSAGPYLLTTNASGTFIDIPSDDDNIGEGWMGGDGWVGRG